MTSEKLLSLSLSSHFCCDGNHGLVDAKWVGNEAPSAISFDPSQQADGQVMQWVQPFYFKKLKKLKTTTFEKEKKKHGVERNVANMFNIEFSFARSRARWRGQCKQHQLSSWWMAISRLITLKTTVDREECREGTNKSLVIWFFDLDLSMFLDHPVWFEDQV